LANRVRLRQSASTPRGTLPHSEDRLSTARSRDLSLSLEQLFLTRHPELSSSISVLFCLLCKTVTTGVGAEEVKRRDSEQSWARARWLHFIVNNTESGLDVDKLDYYQRDCFFTGASCISRAARHLIHFILTLLPHLCPLQTRLLSISATLSA
jgi:hypothetical protein